MKMLWMNVRLLKCIIIVMSNVQFAFYHSIFFWCTVLIESLQLFAEWTLKTICFFIVWDWSTPPDRLLTISRLNPYQFCELDQNQRNHFWRHFLELKLISSVKYPNQNLLRVSWTIGQIYRVILSYKWLDTK